MYDRLKTGPVQKSGLSPKMATHASPEINPGRCNASLDDSPAFFQDSRIRVQANDCSINLNFMLKVPYNINLIQVLKDFRNANKFKRPFQNFWAEES